MLGGPIAYTLTATVNTISDYGTMTKHLKIGKKTYKSYENLPYQNNCEDAVDATAWIHL